MNAPGARLARYALTLWLSAALVAVANAVEHFGGMTPWAAAGQFRVGKAAGRWWFIAPDGRGMILLGLNHLNELKNPADFARTELARRFGSDWPRVFAEVENQCRSWGFNSAGFQAPPEIRATMPYILSTKFMDASFWLERLDYVDVFSPDFAACAETKARAAAAEMKANPMCVAWTWSDCLCWDLRLTRKSHGTDFVSFLRALPPGAAGRVRYLAFLRDRHPDIAQLNAAYGTAFASFVEVAQSDWSTLERERSAVQADDREFLRLIARHYFQTISAPFRREHPDGLLVGDRFHLRDHPDEVLEEAARFCDLIAIQPGDHYQAAVVPLPCPDETRFDGKEFDRLHRLTGKPMLIADHQCGFFDDQTPKTGGWHQYATVEEAADSYARFLRDAFARPYVVGYFRCQYLTSYKDHTRRFKQGLLRPDGTPYQDFVVRMELIHREILGELATGRVAPSPASP